MRTSFIRLISALILFVVFVGQALAWHGSTNVSKNCDGWHVGVSTVWVDQNGNPHPGFVIDSKNLSGSWGNNNNVNWYVKVGWPDSSHTWQDSGSISKPGGCYEPTPTPEQPTPTPEQPTPTPEQPTPTVPVPPTQEPPIEETPEVEEEPESPDKRAHIGLTLNPCPGCEVQGYEYGVVTNWTGSGLDAEYKVASGDIRGPENGSQAAVLKFTLGEVSIDRVNAEVIITPVKKLPGGQWEFMYQNGTRIEFRIHLKWNDELKKFEFEYGNTHADEDCPPCEIAVANKPQVDRPAALNEPGGSVWTMSPGQPF
jgi:hypothetical protein